MDKEISIKIIMNLIKKRFWIILVTTTLFSAVGGIYSIYFTKPLYESSARMIVNAEPNLMNTLMVMIKEPSFLELVVDNMGLQESPEELSQQISAGSIDGSSIVKVSVINSNPELAADIANNTIAVFKREIPNLLGFSNISILSNAKVNNVPINNDLGKKILLSFSVGLITGLGLIFLLDFLDSTLRSESSVEELLGVQVIGTVSKFDKKNTSYKSIKNAKQQSKVRRETLGIYK